ncbi:type II toxin-antitoxin system YafQ family toxin [Lacticaseibacillus manihotivorans]|uniref:type II toxin-antitoxin system YafQ family toxin n=1 Tax=Lacticaseibacillus manihotivorans TaxID=88233 RepID=UPI000AC77DE6|nr:type II toxin-antitoxin system YafQ family toxin [Lacticaseibacillus manihotivorans]
MRAVEYTHTYKKQYKRLKRSGWNMALLDHSVEALLKEDQAELERLWDHQLTGNKKKLFVKSTLVSVQVIGSSSIN